MISVTRHKPNNKKEYFLAKWKAAYRKLFYAKENELFEYWPDWLFANEYKQSGRKLIK